MRNAAKGSSPLARGLPERGPGHRRRRGIIPARAGFTGRSCRCGRRGSDHPRSRGVYAVLEAGCARGAGSSPLARGLRFRSPRRGGATRIIPARAGFTDRIQIAHVMTSDHPRSRGVYSFFSAARVSVGGSSPLARGLRRRQYDSSSCPGIIPARAGFTARAAAHPPSAQDHPRSRGVYPHGHAVQRVHGGSSPLARGLRGPDSQRDSGRRIIPARAGFTPTSTRSGPMPRDHPRSRGVYRPSRTARSRAPGSSPLARGLLPSGSVERKRLRIIPARAGFTKYFPRPRPVLLDHPRSRGVYERSERGRRGRCGSSPLARGLLRGPGRPPEPVGIIPARAGFTGTRSVAGSERTDHPRSRGVYIRHASWELMDAGSSPLARGLRQERARAIYWSGIIPARAGFTRREREGPELRADHPRSRGVYAGAVGVAAVVDGIIPARAGFTSVGEPATGYESDHPRSRGVYQLTAGRTARESGSSPLARGLPRDDGGHVRLGGIIPARAGFTVSHDEIFGR